MNAPTAQAITGPTVSIQRLLNAIEDSDRLRCPPFKMTRLSELAGQQVADAEQCDMEAIIRDTESIARRASLRAKHIEEMTKAMREEAKG